MEFYRNFALIREEIKNDNISIAFQITSGLIKSMKIIDLDNLDSFLVLERRFNNIRREKILGIRSNDEIQRNLNIICINFLQFLSKIESEYIINSNLPTKYKIEKVSSIPNLVSEQEKIHNQNLSNNLLEEIKKYKKQINAVEASLKNKDQVLILLDSLVNIHKEDFNPEFKQAYKSIKKEMNLSEAINNNDIEFITKEIISDIEETKKFYLDKVYEVEQFYNLQLDSVVKTIENGDTDVQLETLTRTIESIQNDLDFIEVKVQNIQKQLKLE